jgi:2,3-bisphosphoglycerate-dependent phosphoglycerate mutase
LASGKRVLVSAHGNSLRGIIKYLSNISDDEIVGLEIPTGKPMVYELAEDWSVQRRFYLGEEA